MPLFETMLQEKPPIVLELGMAYSKIGFAAETHPRFIIPSQVRARGGRLGSGLIKIFSVKDDTDLYDCLVDFLQIVFFKHLLVTPRDRKIVIVESVFCPTRVRETIAKVLFRHYEIISILFVPTHLVALSTLAIDTALVVDLGYQEVTVVPVYAGVQNMYGFQAQNYGGELIHDLIKDKMIKSGVDHMDLPEAVVEDIKVRTCFVTTKARASQYLSGNPPSPCPDVEYPNAGKGLFKVPGELRETVMEVLFPDTVEHSGLPYLILDSILKCPIDMRKSLAENIFLIGGTAMIPGLKARLKEELLALLKSDIYKDKFYIKTVKFHDAPAKPNFTAWLGGSIYGGTDLIVSKGLTKEQYCKYSRVPDWSNLDDNRVIKR